MMNIMRSRSVEFLILGGGSIIIALFLIVLQLTGHIETLTGQYSKLAFTFLILAYVVNYPHALWSYRLAYKQGSRFIFNNWFSLIFFPLMLLALIFLATVAWGISPSEFPALMAIDQWLQKFGIFLNFSVYSSFGQFVFAGLLIFQMTASARHYALQALGVGLTYAHKSEYPVSKNQKNWIRANLTTLWVVNIFWGYTGLSAIRNMDFEYFTPRFPFFLRSIAIASFVITFVGVLYFVVLKNYLRYRKMPSLNAATPILSIYLWLQPFWWPFGYQLWIVPIAHCIQYLFFCFHAERGGELPVMADAPSPRVYARYFIISVFVMVLSYLIFDYVPHHMDYMFIGYFATANMAVVGINVVINLHHYIIDAVVWRKPSSHARQRLILSLRT
jgi:hypothetical protein